MTSSLTKAFGLSGLRCGWVLADQELVHRMWRINDLYAATPAHPAELLSVIAFDHLDKVAARAKLLLEENRRSLNGFLDSRDDLDFYRPEQGTIVFPKLRQAMSKRSYVCCVKSTRPALCRAATSTCRSTFASASEATRR